MIKRFIYTLAVMLYAFGQISAQGNVTISGKISGVDKGRLYVISSLSTGTQDTLGYTDFNTPEFTLNFNVPEAVFTIIVLDKYQGGFNLIAEPGVNYQALLTNDNDAYIKGGALNDSWHSFIKYSDSLKLSLKTLQQEYNELKKSGKFRSASMINDSIQHTRETLSFYTQKYLNENDNVISAFTMLNNAIMTEADLNRCKQLYNSLGNNAKETINGKMLKGRIEEMERISSGSKAPDFNLPDKDGNMIKLSDVKGKVKIIDFWASWCGPCRLNNPNLISLYDKYHSKGLEIVGISLDDNKQRWINAIDKDKLIWINVSSLKGWGCEVAKQYNVKAIPEMFILDENNNIIATHLRGEALKEFIKQQFE